MAPIAKVIELSADADTSFDDALPKTYRLHLQVTFKLD
jgi:flavin-binding protein dodecin